MSGASNSDVFKLFKNTYTSIGCITEEPNIAVRVSDNSINTDFLVRGYDESDCDASDVSDIIFSTRHLQQHWLTPYGLNKVLHSYFLLFDNASIKLAISYTPL